MLLFKQIQFFCWGFPFSAISRLSRVQSPQFVAWSICTVVFLPSSSCVNTTVHMHHMDVNKMHKEKTRWEQYKNFMNYIEQILKATPLKTSAVWLLTSHLKNYPIKMNKTCGTLLEKQGLISNDQKTPAHERVSVGWPTRTYLHQLCMDPGCRLEDLQQVIDNTIYQPLRSGRIWHKVNF